MVKTALFAYSLYWFLNHSYLMKWLHCWVFKRRPDAEVLSNGFERKLLAEFYGCPYCIAFHVGWLSACVDLQFGFFPNFFHCLGYCLECGFVVAILAYFLSLGEEWIAKKISRG